MFLMQIQLMKSQIGLYRLIFVYSKTSRILWKERVYLMNLDDHDGAVEFFLPVCACLVVL